MDGMGKRLARGDESAFAELYDACAEGLHRYLSVRLGSRDDADDVLQETFVRLARWRGKLSRVENVVAYAYTIARHEASRHASRSTSETKRRAAAARELPVQATVNDPAIIHETQDLIQHGLSQLSEQQHEIVELRIYAGLGFREIAQVTRQPQGTVATRYREALARLKEWLGDR